jgi:butyrate kinase
MTAHIILTINPGSTSDEVAVFRGAERLAHRAVHYGLAELAPFEGQRVTAQLTMRRDVVGKTLSELGIGTESLDAAIGRGGLLRPMAGGTYRVDAAMLADLEAGVSGDHPSNLGGILAHGLVAPHGKPAFIADPVVVDELSAVARYSGMPDNPRVSIFHALNHKRVARQVAEQLGKTYAEARLVVVHAGGGISVGAHLNGRVVDVNDALDGEGPFTPQRSGGVPAGGLARLCYSGHYSAQQMRLKIKGRGGLIAYTGTSDVRLLGRFIRQEPLTPQERAELRAGLTPELAREAIDAMVYQVAKEIGAMAVVLRGAVDGVVFTGGLAHAKELVVEPLRKHVSWVAPLFVIPGGDELSALNEAAYRVLEGIEEAKSYRPVVG